MDYCEFAKNISFRVLKPATPRPTGLRKLAMILRRFGIHLEAYNTRLPENQTQMQRRLREICRIPRMSTFAIGALINRAVAQMPEDQAFVNVGVWNGFTFLSGLIDNEKKTCIGVDNFSHKGSPKEAFFRRLKRFGSEAHVFHEADFREYFPAVHRQPIGVYMFDGPHGYQDQLDGLTLAEPYFAENCIIFVDDTNWEHVHRANLDFIENSPNRYRMLLDAQTPHSGHPTFWNGLMIFQMIERRAGENSLPASEPGAATSSDENFSSAA